MYIASSTTYLLAKSLFHSMVEYMYFMYILTEDLIDSVRPVLGFGPCHIQY